MMKPLPNSSPNYPLCRIEFRHTRVRDGILLEYRNKLVVEDLFGFEKPLSRRKTITLLCSSWSLPTIWNSFMLLLGFPTFAFKNLLFEFLSLTVKVRFLE
jgi:hypothetical protein